MSKTTQENKLTITIKRLFYENSIYIRNLWAQTKIMTKTNLPSLPFDSSFTFVNCCKTAKPMTLKFLDFQFVFINFFWKIRCNCMSGLVVRPIYWRYAEKKNIFLLLWILTPDKRKWNKRFRSRGPRTLLWASEE